MSKSNYKNEKTELMLLIPTEVFVIFTLNHIIWKMYFYVLDVRFVFQTKTI